MNFLTTIWNFIKTNWRRILFALMTLTIVFLCIQNCSIRNNSERTIVVMTDSLTTYENKVHELYDAQTTYITSIKDLKKINEELSNEVQNLKDNPLIVTVIKTEYKIDTVKTDPSPILIDSVDKQCSYPWGYDNEWFKIDGNSTFDLNAKTGITDINNLFVKSAITLDIIENKNQDLQILVKTDNPYCDITSINGAIISPEKVKSVSSRVKNDNKWGIGFQLGFGAGYGAGIYQQNVILTPYLGFYAGFGISYNITTF